MLSVFSLLFFFFFFNDTATTEIYTLSLHDALPISVSSLLSGLRNPQGIALDAAGNLFVTEFDAGRIDQLVRAFVLGPAAVTRVDSTTVTVCPSVRRAAGYALPLAVSLADSHGGLQAVIASLPAAGDTS